MKITENDLQSLDIFFAPQKSVNDIANYLIHKTILLEKIANCDRTSLVDYSKIDYMSFVSEFEWSNERFEQVLKFLDVKITEEHNPNENTITLYGKGDFLIYESLTRHHQNKSNPFLQFELINNKIKFQKENN